MEQTFVKIRSVEHLTHDVLRIQTEKPPEYDFKPGQATEVSINKVRWDTEKRPFTFTCLPDDEYLEFTIKTYPAHKGLTNELLHLKPGDELIVHDIFGAITYKGEGVFIAGGAGVTPFISILRSLNAKKEVGNNKLLFANKTVADIILREEFESMLGKNFVNILSDEDSPGYTHGFINEKFLEANITNPEQLVYVCGPEPMMEAVEKMLSNLGISEERVIKEQF